MLDYLIGLAGMWLFCDGIISLHMYIGRDGQSWIGDHSIRIIRIAIGIALMVAGGIMQ